MRISDVLQSKGSAEVATIRPDATVRELLTELATHNVGALVVSEDGTSAIGIVSERDVVRHLNDDDAILDGPVSAIMTTSIRVGEPDDSLDRLMSLMTEHRVRHVPVVKDGQLVGIVSIGDAVKQRLSQLEFERDQLNKYVAGAQ
ncbi:MAG TPA: CBS domain-containing protein [Nocardioidaceae bacterium]|nr:CBS domain-containing protein [Nocardioidaceae bacterium]